MIVYLLAIGVMMTGIYAVTMKDNLIKKLLGLSIMTNGIHIFLIALGYREGGIMPTLLRGMDIQYFYMNAVDPLPQALVLTSIVINLSVLAVGLSITILLYRKFGTLDSSRIRRLSG